MILSRRRPARHFDSDALFKHQYAIGDDEKYQVQLPFHLRVTCLPLQTTSAAFLIVLGIVLWIARLEINLPHDSHSSRLFRPFPIAQTTWLNLACRKNICRERKCRELMVKFLTGNGRTTFSFHFSLSTLESPGRSSLNFSHGISARLLTALQKVLYGTMDWSWLSHFVEHIWTVPKTYELLTIA